MLTEQIVDTHLHIWDTNRLHYPWLNDVPTLNRPFSIDDYRQATTGLSITSMVFLQCDCAVDLRAKEIEYVKDAARQDPRIRAIVPYAPLEEGDSIRPELERLAADPMICGVRRIVQGEPDIEYCLRPGMVRGVQILGELDLHFEICLYHPQLPAAVKLVRRSPGVRFILDHIGKPDICSGQLSPWRENISALAALPNVWCKVSGMVTEADKTAWTIQDLRPFAETIFENFGFDRVVYGGDWPVVTLASSYARWIEALDVLTQNCSADERRRLFHDNALRFYRLTEPKADADPTSR